MTWLSDLNREQVQWWQRQLNRFTERYFDDIQPIRVDGDVGPKTRDRVRDCKYWIGYQKRWRDPSVSREFLWRLNHPNKVRVGTRNEANDRERVKRGKRRRKLHRDRADDSAWSHCRGVTDRIIRIVRRHRPGARITSRKRSETFGNRGSDHNVENKDADAVDFALANDQELIDIISREIGGPRDVADFQHFFITDRGMRFRIQLIAMTHGTGPHTHAGVKRA